MDETMMEVVKPRQQGDVATMETDQARAVAETQAAMVIAKRFPRDPVRCRDRILDACARPKLAEAALYEYSRGGTAITGPSIRLAECLAQNWGNLQFGIRELDQREGASTVEAFAWDIETNTRQVKVFQVKHIRHTKKGSYRLEDPRDQYEMVANQGARRLRACILGVIPGDVIEEAVQQCETTLKLKADVTPERVASMIERFGSYGVTRQQVEKRIQRRIDTITPGQMVLLGKIYNSLKDGMSSSADWFEPEEHANGNGTASTKPPAEALKDKLKKKKDPPPAAPPVDHAGTTILQPETVACPDKDGADVPVGQCATCESREDCPSHDGQEGGAA